MENLKVGHPTQQNEHLYEHEDASKYDPDIYGGVQNHFDNMVHLINDYSKLEVFLFFALPQVIDFPFSIVLDTATLPYTVYYEIKQEIQEEESTEKEEKHGVSVVGDEVNLKHDISAPSVLAVNKRAWA